jgi:serine/threonine protein kinase
MDRAASKSPIPRKDWAGTPPERWDPCAEDRERLPDEIDGYRIERGLAMGSRGVILLAREPDGGDRVALKLVKLDGRGREQERLRRGAEALARLDHPAVARLRGHGAEDYCGYEAVEYVGGGSLRDWLARSGPLEPRRAAARVAEFARGIEHCHGQGIRHCHLNPLSVLCAEDGGLRAIDFGLRMSSFPEEPPRTQEEHRLVFGSMAPEQGNFNPKAHEAGVDIYGLGAILCFSLTGAPPFEGEIPAEVLQKVAHEPSRRPSTLRSDLSSELDAICAWALAKEPEDRYASPAALAEDLDRFLAGEPTLAPPLPSPGLLGKLKRVLGGPKEPRERPA